MRVYDWDPIRAEHYGQRLQLPPSGLTQQIPQLADYGYAKMKDQILLVNAMTGKIVDIIPETQPQTSGQK